MMILYSDILHSYHNHQEHKEELLAAAAFAAAMKHTRTDATSWRWLEWVLSQRSDKRSRKGEVLSLWMDLAVASFPVVCLGAFLLLPCVAMWGCRRALLLRATTTTTTTTRTSSSLFSSSSRAPLFVSRQWFCAAAAAPSKMELLKDLRSRSGAPVVDCKKALDQSGNNVSKAMEWLRRQGSAKVSSKLQGREALEGLVGMAMDGSSATLVKVSSETDFASRSDAFVDFVTHVAQTTLTSTNLPIHRTLEQEDILSEANDDDNDNKTIQQSLEEALVAIRENVRISRVLRLQIEEGDEGIWAGYVHGRVGSSRVAGAAAALVHVVGRAKDEDDPQLAEVGKKLAMHIVAARPRYMSPDTVPQDVLETERSILREQMADTGKPPEILDKIIQGRLRKFYESVCLTEQAHMVEEGNPKVSKVLKGAGVEVKRFESLWVR